MPSPYKEVAKLDQRLKQYKLFENKESHITTVKHLNVVDDTLCIYWGNASSAYFELSSEQQESLLRLLSRKGN